LITVTPNSGQSSEYSDAKPVLTYALSRTMGASSDALVNSNTLIGALPGADLCAIPNEFGCER